MARRFVQCSRPDLWTPAGSLGTNWLLVDNADRIIDWSKVGVWYGAIKGIPTLPVGITMQSTNPAGAYYVDATGATDCRPAIQAALDACPSPGAVVLPAGRFRIDGSVTDPVHGGVTFYGTFGLLLYRDAVVLRGSGPGTTTIVSYSTASNGAIAMRFRAVGPAMMDQSKYTNVVGGAVKGSTQIAVASAADIAVGDMVSIDVLNDDQSGLFDPLLVHPYYEVTNLNAGGVRTTWEGRYGASGMRCSGQLVMVTGKVGNTLTINRALYDTPNPALLPQVGSEIRTPVTNAGVENMTIEAAPGVLGWLMHVYGTSYCWVNKVQFKNVAYRACYGFGYNFGFEGRRCFLNDAALFGGAQGYGFSFQANHGECLLEDNIADGMHSPFFIDSGGAGCVVGYNYSRRNYQDYVGGSWHINDFGTHAPHEKYHLFEGNIGGKLTFDGYWGSASRLIALRNWLLGRDEGNPNAVQNVHAAVVDMANHYMTFAGNVLGEPGYLGILEDTPNFHLAYDNYPGSLWKVGYHGLWDQPPNGYRDYRQGLAPDPTCAATLLRQGNYNYATLSVDGTVGRTIPDSLYHGAKPSFFGSMPWPCIGPDIAGYNLNNPAKQRWSNYVLSGNLADLFADMPTTIIVDHNHTNLALIPAAWITKAKADLHVAFAHTSYGMQITSGLNGLVTRDGSKYAWNWGGTGGALDLRDYNAESAVYIGAGGVFACDLGYGWPPGTTSYTQWEAAVRALLATNPGLNVITLSWCWQMNDTEANINTYLALMNGLEVDFPSIKFVYQTGNTCGGLDVPGGGWPSNYYLRKKQIRDYCVANHKILFDFGDIEMYDPDGVYYGNKLCDSAGYFDYDNDGAVDYDQYSGGLNPTEPIRSYNWMLKWQDAHPGQWFAVTPDAPHTVPLNANFKAYAWWWLMARLAGWSGV